MCNNVKHITEIRFIVYVFFLKILCIERIIKKIINENLINMDSFKKTINKIIGMIKIFK